MVKDVIKRRSVIIPLCLLVFLVFYLIVGLSMGPLMLESGLTNENFLPVVFSIGGILLCVSLISDGVKEDAPSEGSGRQKQHFPKKQVVLITDFFLFVILYATSGIISSSFVFVFLFMLFFDDQIRHVVRKLIYSALITACIYILYAVIFGVHF